MIKVAIILPSLANTGPIIVAQNIINQLASKISFQVFYFDDIKEIQFNCPCNKISFFAAPNLNDFDIIHSHMLRPDCFVWWHKNKTKAKLITTMHQYIFQNLHYSYNSLIASIFTKIWIYFINSFNQVICINSHMSAYYRSKLKTKISFIYNGINCLINKPIAEVDFKKIEDFKKNYKLIGSVSQLTERKGLDQIIKALPQMPDYAYLVIGDGKERIELENLAKFLKVSDRVLFLGYKANGASYIHRFDCFVMPSRSEGFGLSLMEAIACKKNVVCSNIESFNELLSADEVTFFELENIVSLQKAIIKTFEINYNKTNKAFNKLNTLYTDKVMSNHYFQLYCNLTNSQL